MGGKTNGMVQQLTDDWQSAGSSFVSMRDERLGLFHDEMRRNAFVELGICLLGSSMLIERS